MLVMIYQAALTKILLLLFLALLQPQEVHVPYRIRLRGKRIYIPDQKPEEAWLFYEVHLYQAMAPGDPGAV